MSLTRRRLLAPTIIGALAACLLIVYPQIRPLRADAQQTQVSSTDISSVFSVTSEGITLPPAYSEHLRSTFEHLGLTLNATRSRMAFTGNGRELMVATGADKAGDIVYCLAGRLNGVPTNLNCAPLKSGSSSYDPILQVGEAADGTWRIDGLVPDQVGSPTIELRSGENIPIDITANTFSILLADEPRSMSYVRADGSDGSIAFENKAG